MHEKFIFFSTWIKWKRSDSYGSNSSKWFLENKPSKKKHRKTVVVATKVSTKVSKVSDDKKYRMTKDNLLELLP